MTTPFTFKRLPFAVTLPSAPIIASADVSPLIPPAELPVDAYWLFGTDNTGLTDSVGLNPLCRNLYFTIAAGGTGYTSAPAVTLTGASGASAVAIISGGAVTGVTLTAPPTDAITAAPTVTFSGGGRTGAAATAFLWAAPTLGVNSLTTAAALQQGLLLPFNDSSEFTVIAVVKRATGSHILFGTLTVSSAPATGGDAMLNTAGVYSVNTRGGSNVTVVPPTGVATNGWMMVAMTYSAAGGRNRITHYGDAGSLLKYSAVLTTKTAASPMRKLALGGAYYTSAFNASLEVAALLYANTQLTDAQMAAVYARLRSDLSLRGVTLY